MTGKIDLQAMKWIEAGEILARDPKAIVACPKCGQGTLHLIDVRVDPTTVARDIQCLTCRARVAASITDPAQAIKLFVVSDRQLSSVAEWQAAIDGEGYPLRLDGSKLTATLNGFLPARLRDVETGFECDTRPSTNVDQNRKHALALQWAGHWNEIPAVWMAAAAYAKATDGEVFDRESGLTRSADDARGLVERIERDMPRLEALQRGSRRVDED
jgi:hypothetical protein